MKQIILENLTKTFHIAEREQGFCGAIKGLFHRRYRIVEALAGINFDIDARELVGYIGANAAGKSTSVKILSGILVPSSGRCEIINLVP